MSSLHALYRGSAYASTSDNYFISILLNSPPILLALSSGPSMTFQTTATPHPPTLTRGDTLKEEG